MTQNNNKPNKTKQSQTKIKQYRTTSHKNFYFCSFESEIFIPF